ncbi:amino acid ABC transporter permease [Parafannyhessea umbonata]|uniref:ABC transporter permease subunit n=1 Tax=Parafannyhessea umbonata TaxID=604330 RepID=A0A1H1MCZ1_9ACTN|nr:ABC transporter permease subunit [Parafannyhessea umbonata]MBM6989033.1 ABC transporter permease subunit [Parafannyhessea umbonata]MCI6682576.1 ABC transporter permease subunit [Parafannyhessea umbonata]MCI7219667.1 ABC transporter permease subunit [Parafannyhessea umbonata]MDD6360196.1 ABC transporter permease subunit [Parafannyhessea umbonata]MDD6565559.1 ABC transporter permease subunit [Parafannyhessea umbonata]
MSIQELFSLYGGMYVKAYGATLWMTVVSYVGAMLLALLVTIARVSPISPLRKVGDLYVQIFRNVATISLLIIFYYAFPYLGVVWSEQTCVIVVTVLVAASFGSENFMTGINTIGVGQIEAARSLGLSFRQMLKNVVIPQALRSSVLPMTNLLVAVMLTTAIGSQVPLDPQELTGLVSYINTMSVGGILPFAVSAVLYAGTAFLIGLAGNAIDKRVRILR